MELVVLQHNCNIYLFWELLLLEFYYQSTRIKMLSSQLELLNWYLLNQKPERVNFESEEEEETYW